MIFTISTLRSGQNFLGNRVDNCTNRIDGSHRLLRCWTYPFGRIQNYRFQMMWRILCHGSGGIYFSGGLVFGRCLIQNACSKGGVFHGDRFLSEEQASLEGKCSFQAFSKSGLSNFEYELASTRRLMRIANPPCQVQNFTIDVDHGRASHVEFYQDMVWKQEHSHQMIIVDQNLRIRSRFKLSSQRTKNTCVIFFESASISCLS